MITGIITAKPQVFAAAVKWAAKFVEPRPTVPVQGGLLLTASAGRLRVSAMNENVTAEAILPVEGGAEGAVVVSGRLLAELVATFPDKPVTIQGEGETVVITVGRWVGTLPGMDASDYPTMPAPPQAFGTINGEVLHGLVSRVAIATDKDPDKKHEWRSVHLTFGENEVRVVATDSVRMASDSAPFIRDGGVVGEAALVLAGPMADVAASFVGPDPIAVGIESSRIGFGSATRVVIMRQVDAREYPIDFVRKIVATEPAERALVATRDIAGPLKRAQLVRAKDGPVAVRFSEKTVTLAADAEELNQSGAEEIDADYAGPDAVLHFNPKYLADAMSTAPGPVVSMALTSVERGARPQPVVLTVEGTSWRHILMPIKK